MITLILPYYRNPEMLRRQAVEWKEYPKAIEVVVVDDGSPVERADDVLPDDSRAMVYRIAEDIPWNRNGARNLGTHVAGTEWIIHTDIDHVLPSDSANRLLKKHLSPQHWYKFPRYRVGKADLTRQKDDLEPDCEFGPIKPHIDSFVCTRDRFWQAGGYDEDYSGSLGGSAPFLANMEAISSAMLFDDIELHVHTSDVVDDASDIHLSRDRSRFKKLRKQKGNAKPTDWLRFEWERIR